MNAGLALGRVAAGASDLAPLQPNCSGHEVSSSNANLVIPKLFLQGSEGITRRPGHKRIRLFRGLSLLSLQL